VIKYLAGNDNIWKRESSVGTKVSIPTVPSLLLFPSIKESEGFVTNKPL
jgi:hypothetical protein